MVNDGELTMTIVVVVLITIHMTMVHWNDPSYHDETIHYMAQTMIVGSCWLMLALPLCLQ